MLDRSEDNKLCLRPIKTLLPDRPNSMAVATTSGLLNGRLMNACLLRFSLYLEILLSILIVVGEDVVANHAIMLPMDFQRRAEEQLEEQFFTTVSPAWQKSAVINTIIRPLPMPMDDRLDPDRLENYQRDARIFSIWSLNRDRLLLAQRLQSETISSLLQFDSLQLSVQMI